MPIAVQDKVEPMTPIKPHVANLEGAEVEAIVQAPEEEKGKMADEEGKGEHHRNIFEAEVVDPHISSQA
jgi:hypothetical protein